MTNHFFTGLLDGGWRKQIPEFFRDGVTVRWLHRGGPGAPTAAILEYAPGARIPRHRHQGLETIVVLDGVQSDEAGDYAAGTAIFNPPGSEHSVWSADGCAVFIQWNPPVFFVAVEDAN